MPIYLRIRKLIMTYKMVRWYSDICVLIFDYIVIIRSIEFKHLFAILKSIADNVFIVYCLIYITSVVFY